MDKPITVAKDFHYDSFSKEITEFSEWWKNSENKKPTYEPKWYGWTNKDTKKNYCINDLLGFVPMPLIDQMLDSKIIRRIKQDNSVYWSISDIVRFNDFSDKKIAMFSRWSIEAERAGEMFKAHQPV